MALATIFRLSPFQSFQPGSMILGQTRNYMKNFFNKETICVFNTTTICVVYKKTICILN